MIDDPTVSLRTKYWPAYVLRQEAKPFDFDNPPINPEALKGAMEAVMQANNGIGLAAPQVNFLYRVFIMGGPYSTEAVFNPEIVDQSKETVVDTEGCISFPGIYVDIERPKWIEVKYQNEHGEWQNFEVHDYDARVFLHEFDHLNGITFNKKVTKLKWDRAKRKAKKEKLINTN